MRKVINTQLGKGVQVIREATPEERPTGSRDAQKGAREHVEKI